MSASPVRLALAALALSATAAAAQTTQPKHHSKLKGAIVGAAAGHAAGHHAVAGAIAGAAVQHHRNVQARKQAAGHTAH